MKALERSQVARYKREGYLVIDDLLALEVMGELRTVTDSFVASSRRASSSDSVLDFEATDSRGEHHLRRISHRSVKLQFMPKLWVLKPY